MILLLLAGVLLLGGCSGSEGRKHAHMERGLNHVASGAHDKGRVEFKNVLEIDPHDVPARMALADTLSKLGSIRAALGHYLRIVEDEPQFGEARVRLGVIYLVGGNRPRRSNTRSKG